MRNRKNMMPNKFDIIRKAKILAIPPNISKTSHWWEKKYIDESTIESGSLCRMSSIVWGSLILEPWDTLISLAVISEQLMAVIRSQMIQRIMTGMSPLGLAVHITGGMVMTIMITYICTSSLNCQIWLVQSQIDIAAGSTLKISAKCISICTNYQNYQNWLVWSPNWHHSWIHIEKWVLDIYNTSYIEHM